VEQYELFIIVQILVKKVTLRVLSFKMVIWQYLFESQMYSNFGVLLPFSYIFLILYIKKLKYVFYNFKMILLFDILFEKILLVQSFSRTLRIEYIS